MRVLGYLQDSTSDGEGLRDVLFVSACSHVCIGCHNKKSWSPLEGTFFTDSMEKKFIAHAKRLNPPAVTLSGGDPLHEANYTDILKLCKKLKEEKINVWLYTGYTYAQVRALFPEVLNYIDVLVDGKYVEELKDQSIKFRGSSNQKIIRSPFK